MGRKTAKQVAILNAMKAAKETGGDVEISTEDVQEIPDGPRRYMGLPGTTLVGIGVFPMTVEDPEVQERIENSRSFKSGHVWIDMKTPEDAETADKLLKNLPISQLQKLAVALGQRNIGRLTKLELIEVCTRDGASLL